MERDRGDTTDAKSLDLRDELSAGATTWSTTAEQDVNIPPCESSFLSSQFLDLVANNWPNSSLFWTSRVSEQLRCSFRKLNSKNSLILCVVVYVGGDCKLENNVGDKRIRVPRHGVHGESTLVKYARVCSAATTRRLGPWLDYNTRAHTFASERRSCFISTRCDYTSARWTNSPLLDSVEAMIYGPRTVRHAEYGAFSLHIKLAPCWMSQGSSSTY